MSLAIIRLMMIKRINKLRNKKLLLGLLLLAITLILLFLLWLLFEVKSIRLTDNRQSSRPISKSTINSIITPSPNSNKERSASFTDLFSGSAWLDKNRTSLFHNFSSMTLSFPPDIHWELTGSCLDNYDACQAIDRSIDQQSTCIDGRCLVMVDDNLVYQGQTLAWPTAINEIVDSTISTFDNRWLVGIVDNFQPEQYRISVWWFDGQDFQPIILSDNSEEPIISHYRGRLAVGGQADNLLVLYSAYNGLAWQVRGSQFKDLSYYFGIRVNYNGFWPGIISYQYNGETKWLVFDRSQSRPILLKFWQNGSDWIEGTLDLSDQLPDNSRTAIVATDKLLDNFKIKINDLTDTAYLWQMVDQGFILPTSSAEVISINLSTYSQKPQTSTIGAIITEVIGGWSGFDNSWFLSTDGVNWQTVQLNQRFNFDQPIGKLWWRWQVNPKTNRQHSPCLKKIMFYFYFQP